MKAENAGTVKHQEEKAQHRPHQTQQGLKGARR